MPRGGYRKPAKPAPVSGPGALSRRTDGGPAQGAKYMAGGKYGEGKQLMEAQQGAPMAKEQPAPKAQIPKLTQLFAPTSLPSEPVTAGMSFGPGGGPEIVPGVPRQDQSLSSTLAKIIPNDPSGQTTELYNYLISRGL